MGVGSSNARFTAPSDRYPPRNALPDGIFARCKVILIAVSSLLNNCERCYPADNLLPGERQELDRLVADKSVVISPADKGGMWIVVPAKDYEAEAFRQLADDSFYQVTDVNLTKFTERRLRIFMRYLKQNRFISRREEQALLPPSDPRDRSFYLIPKVHKEKWPSPLMPPGRPIVADRGSVSRKCASLVEHFLAPIARSLPSYVRDSLHVVALVNELTLSENAIMFTMDVSSLYTNIPIVEEIEAVGRAFLKFPDRRRPDLSILSILRLLLTSNDFSFGRERYLQIQGTAMGSAYGASFASIFLGELEEHVYSREKTLQTPSQAAQKPIVRPDYASRKTDRR